MDMQYTNELTPKIRAELAFAKYADGSTVKIVSGADFLASVALGMGEEGEK